ALADDVLHLLPHRVEGDVEGLHRLRGDALALVDQPEQDVLGADVVVVEHPRFFLREDDHAASTVREPLEHDTSPNERGRVSSRLTTPTPRFCRCSPQAARRVTPCPRGYRRPARAWQPQACASAASNAASAAGENSTNRTRRTGPARPSSSTSRMVPTATRATSVTSHP